MEMGIRSERGEKNKEGSLVRPDGGVFCTKALDRFNIHQEKKKKKSNQ